MHERRRSECDSSVPVRADTLVADTMLRYRHYAKYWSPEGKMHVANVVMSVKPLLMLIDRVWSCRQA